MKTILRPQYTLDAGYACSPYFFSSAISRQFPGTTSSYSNVMTIDKCLFNRTYFLRTIQQSNIAISIFYSNILTFVGPVVSAALN
ncbi:MAG: hypothetical protein VX893_08005 [Candidatus Latescibacterota bacterium]|nr:hypothetical protein [Candidatus Latescibacterota bacterium]